MAKRRLASTIESATDKYRNPRAIHVCSCSLIPSPQKGRKSSLGMRLLSLQGDLHLLRSSKMSGRRKLSKDHSSARLFCSGVPVSSSLLAASYDFRALESNGNINILFT